MTASQLTFGSVALALTLTILIASLDAQAMPKSTMMAVLRSEGLTVVDAKLGKAGGRGMDGGKHLLSITSQDLSIDVYGNPETNYTDTILRKKNTRIWGFVDSGLHLKGGTPRYFAHDKAFTYVTLVFERHGDWQLIRWKQVRNPEYRPYTDAPEYCWRED